MSALTTERIARLVARRERLTNRRDGRINFPAVNEIDEKLREVPAGERPDVDALLGRYASIAEALEREGERLIARCTCGAGYLTVPRNHDASCALRPATDTAAATNAVAELASEKMSEFEAHMRLLCADYEIEAPDYPGMWK